MISIIIPVYNEESSISNCIKSLLGQSNKDFEIIIVDDGSEDKSELRIKNYKLRNKNLRLYKQEHQGPGTARNLGVKHSKGDILVFVDSDMTFHRDFVKNLIKPILEGKSKGTFTKEEYVSNWDNSWARCWNYYQGIADKRRIPSDFPDESPVFRAIKKKEFLMVGGFDPIGFTDDWTLSLKLGFKADSAKGSICYHDNPSSAKDVFLQARWIGKNEFMTGSFIRKLYNLIRFNPLVQFVRSFYLSFKFCMPFLIVFSIVYSSAVTVSIIGSFIGENKNK